MSEAIEVTGDATFPPHSEWPVRPAKSASVAPGKGLIRCVRVQLDVYLAPGESEKLLLLDGKRFDVTFRERPTEAFGASRVGDAA